MARPLQKPNITGEGNNVMKRESLVIETTTIKNPARITFGGLVFEATASDNTEKRGRQRNFWILQVLRL